MNSFKFDDFTIDLVLNIDDPKYDRVEIGIDQSGYYGASLSTSIYDQQLDDFLNKIVEFKALRDKNKETK